MLLTSESWAPGRLRELGNKQEIFETEKETYRDLGQMEA